MSTIAVVVAVEGSGGASPGPLGRVAASAVAAGLGEVVVVVGPAASLSHLPAEVTVLVDRADTPSEAAALRAAVDYAQRSGADALLVALGEALAAGRRGRPGELAPHRGGAGRRDRRRHRGGRPAGLVRLAAAVWPLLPLEGRFDRMLSAQTARVTTCPLDFPGGSPSPAARAVRRSRCG